MSVFAALLLVCAADIPDAPAGDRFAARVDVGDDLDGDGARDVLVVDAGRPGARPGVWLLSGRSGKALRHVPGHALMPILDAAFTGDIDLDGRSDVVVTITSAGGSTSWFALSGASGKVLWKRTREELEPIGWVGDVDGDGCREQACVEIGIVRPRNGPDRIRLVSGRDGEPGLHFELERATRRTLADAGDLDGDGRAEIAVVSARAGRSDVGAYSPHAGRWVWTADDAALVTDVLLGVAGGRDVDGDGVPDVVVSSPSQGFSIVGGVAARDPHRLRVLSGRDGRTLALYPIAAEDDGASFGASLALLDDIDGDARPEILAGNAGDGLHGSVVSLDSRSGEARALVGPAGGFGFGRQVIGAGDLDGDGAGDFLVTQSPRGVGRHGALIAVSGATSACLWRVTRRDAEAALAASTRTAPAVEAASVAAGPDAAGSAATGPNPASRDAADPDVASPKGTGAGAAGRRAGEAITDAGSKGTPDRQAAPGPR